MKRSIICAIGIGALAVASGGWYGLHNHASPEPVATAAASEALPLGKDWHSVDNFMKQQEAATTAVTADDRNQAEKRAERQAELRARLQPPMLPLILIADQDIKSSPKSHWGDGADISLTGSRLAPRPMARDESVPEMAVAQPTVKDDSLVSDHARETVAMLEAFKAALQDTGGAETFKAATATPYTDR